MSGMKVYKEYKKMLNSEFLFIQSLATQSLMKVCNMFLKNRVKRHGIVIPDFSQTHEIKGKKREDGRGKRNNIFPCRYSGE